MRKVSKKKLNHDQRTQIINELIVMTYDSLKSHIPFTHGEMGKKAKALGDSPKFQRRCVREYSWMIFLLSRLY